MIRENVLEQSSRIYCSKNQTALSRVTHLALQHGKSSDQKEVVATTYQAISGAGKTFKEWPEMVENIIPYIGGEEEKERAGAASCSWNI